MGKGASILCEYSEGGDIIMEGSIKELVMYRMERTREMLEAAESNLNSGKYGLR